MIRASLTFTALTLTYLWIGSIALGPACDPLPLCPAPLEGTR
jgi:hypothetical protein